MIARCQWRDFERIVVVPHQQLHEEILAELAFEPDVHPERIGVSVEQGVVTLSGHVDSYGDN